MANVQKKRPKKAPEPASSPSIGGALGAISATQPTPEATDFHFARHVPALSAGAKTLHRGLLFEGSAWHRVDAVLAAELRAFPLSDLPDGHFGGRSFRPRFDVLSASQFEALVEAERAKISADMRARAEEAAVAAIATQMPSQRVIDLGSSAIVSPERI